MSQNQTLRHDATAALKDAVRADSENVALAALTGAAGENLRGRRGASVEARQKAVGDAVTLVTAAHNLTASDEAEAALDSALVALGQITFPESKHKPVENSYDSYDEDEYSDDEDEDDDES